MQYEHDVCYELKEHLGVIRAFPNGWNRELNIVSWNGREEKYDIRDWDPDHQRMSKGITFQARDMSRMVSLYLDNINEKVVEESRSARRAKEERRANSPRHRYDDSVESFDDRDSDFDEEDAD